MEKIIEWAVQSPYLTFFIVWIFFDTVFRCYNRTIRAMNIRKNGWPPEHCDADGDFKYVETEDEDNDQTP